EDQAFAVSRAWSEAAEELRGQLSQVRAAKEATEASYISGAGGAEMLARFDELAAGEQSLEALAVMCGELSDAAFDMGTQLQSAKLNIIVTLCWLAIEIMLAWLFPPTAPANEAAAIGAARTVMAVLEQATQKALTSLAMKLGASASKKYVFKSFRLLPTAQELAWGVSTAVKGAAEEMVINAAIQGGQLAAGTAREFNGEDFMASAVGGAVGELAGDLAAKWLGKKLDDLYAANPKVGEAFNSYWGQMVQGGVVGAVADGVGGIFGSIAGSLAVGAPIESAFEPQGIVGGFIQGSIPGAVGGFRNFQVQQQNLAGLGGGEGKPSGLGVEGAELDVDGLEPPPPYESGGQFPGGVVPGRDMGAVEPPPPYESGGQFSGGTDIGARANPVAGQFPVESVVA
ncbi:WXG100-like domain-containing protein, partial [Nocardia takedensis]